MWQSPLGSETPDADAVLSVQSLCRRGRGMLESSTKEVGDITDGNVNNNALNTTHVKFGLLHCMGEACGNQ